jgi:hypothetical protein
MRRALQPALLFAGFALVAGCGEEAGTTAAPAPSATTPPEIPPPMGSLPPATPAESEQFVTAGACAQCHDAGESLLLRDAAGNDVSAVYSWRSSVMAFAARDPYYLAVWSEERRLRPGAEDTVDRICSRCHAPAGSEASGRALSFEDLTEDTDDIANLGRDGVTCTLCHQIQAEGLGEIPSFTGGFSVGFERALFGPHAGPNAEPMEFFVGFTPTEAPHVSESALCATCHTVVVPVLGLDGKPTGQSLVEQAPFLEWSASSYAADKPCGHCHVPTQDEAGNPLILPLAKYPDNLLARQPFGRHLFVGGNAYLLELLADDVAWTGSKVSADELRAAAERSREHLRSAAEVAILAATPEGENLVVTVEIDNHTGHKLPTGYPSRRVFLHLRALDAGGAVLFESGAWDESGALLGAGGARIDGPGVILPHRDTIESADEVAIYSAVPVDAAGLPTHLALDSAGGYARDNRLLPEGFSPTGAFADWIAPVGTDGDADFAPGSDRVKYHLPGGAQIARVEVEVLYQSLSAATVEALATLPNAAAARFSLRAAARAPAPVVLAAASWER